MSKANQSLAQWADGVDDEETAIGVVLDPTEYESWELQSCPGCLEFVKAEKFNDHLAECDEVNLYLADDEDEGKECPYCENRTTVLPAHLGVCLEADHGGGV